MIESHWTSAPRPAPVPRQRGFGGLYLFVVGMCFFCATEEQLSSRCCIVLTLFSSQRSNRFMAGEYCSTCSIIGLMRAHKSLSSNLTFQVIRRLAVQFLAPHLHLLMHAPCWTFLLLCLALARHLTHSAACGRSRVKCVKIIRTSLGHCSHLMYTTRLRNNNVLISVKHDIFHETRAAESYTSSARPTVDLRRICSSRITFLFLPQSPII